MNRERYPILLGQLLDGEISSAEAEELIQGLHDQPELQRDLRRHLILWDAWSQHLASERSTESFVEAWKTRIRAEAGAEQFSQSVQKRIRALEATRGHRLPFWSYWLRPFQIAMVVFAIVVVTTASWWAHNQMIQTKAAHENAQFLSRWGTNKIVTVEGEGACVWCVLSVSNRPGPAIRVKQGAITNIVFINFSGYSQALHPYFTGGTTVRAKGMLTEVRGRLVLTAESITLNGREVIGNPVLRR